MNRVRLVEPDDLGREEWDAWSTIQETNPSLDSPFFRPELALAVSAARGGVEVAVMEQSDQPIGFFPFQRNRRDVVQAVAGRLSEFHGVISPADAEWSADELLAGGRIAAWHFDHLVMQQRPLHRYHWGVSPSPYLDLAHGFDGWRNGLRARGSRGVAAVLRKGRKLAREVGPLRLDFHTTDDDVFGSLIEWKTAQHRRTRVLQVLQAPWVVELLRRVRRHQDHRFSGVLSALYAGRELVAAHLGLCSQGVLHWWFSRLQPDSVNVLTGTCAALRTGPIGQRETDCGASILARARSVTSNRSSPETLRLPKVHWTAGYGPGRSAARGIRPSAASEHLAFSLAPDSSRRRDAPGSGSPFDSSCSPPRVIRCPTRLVRFAALSATVALATRPRGHGITSTNGIANGP